MEENKTNEMIEEIDTVDEVEIEVYDEPEENDSSLLGKVLKVLFGVGLATAATICYVKRDEIKEKRRRKLVDKLEKEGYVIFAPGDDRHLVTDDEEPEVYDSDEE